MSQTEKAVAPLAILRPPLPLGVVAAISCVGFFMVILDATIVTLALPQMRDGLHLSPGAQQWVVSSYLVTLGGLLLLSARAADLFGQKRVFLFGAGLFTLASLAGGLATGATMLIIARFVQGVGAAALSPSSLSLITISHPEGPLRRRALMLYSIIRGAAGTFGVILGGVLTTELSWRWVLLVNVPLGVAVFVAAQVCLLPARATRAQRRLDLPGALTATLGIGALSYGLSQASNDGWGSSKVVIALIAAAVLIISFVIAEATGSQPLVPLALFRLRSLVVGNLVTLLTAVTMNASFFFLSLYLQQAIGYSALRAGLALVPVTIVMIVVGFASRKLTATYGPRLMIIIGGVLTGAGMAWLAAVPSQPPVFWVHVLGPTLLAGAGMGIMLLALTLTATTGVRPENAGVAAGLLSTSRQVGGAIGLAALVTIAATAGTHAIHHGVKPLDALVHGYRVVFLVNAGVMVASILTAMALPAYQRHRTAASPPATPLTTTTTATEPAAESAR